MRRSGPRTAATLIALILAAVAILAVLNWQSVVFTVAILASERRPALLNDAAWDSPASARKFNQRFPAGTPESQLTDWLTRHDFKLGPAGHAERAISGLPCNEDVSIDWRSDDSGRLVRATATVRQIACL